MRVENETDAKGVVRKYINGTRSRHGKIASIVINDKPTKPKEKGVWTIEGSYLTEDGDRSEFTASVTSRGEVVMTIRTPPEKTTGRRSGLVSR